MERENIHVSDEAMKELLEMKEVCEKALMALRSTVSLKAVEGTEQKIDDMTARYREAHIHRMKNGQCSEEACILYSEILTDFERVGDHVLNIAQELNATQQTLA